MENEIGRHVNIWNLDGATGIFSFFDSSLTSSISSLLIKYAPRDEKPSKEKIMESLSGCSDISSLVFGEPNEKRTFSSLKRQSFGQCTESAQSQQILKQRQGSNPTPIDNIILTPLNLLNEEKPSLSCIKEVGNLEDIPVMKDIVVGAIINCLLWYNQSSQKSNFNPKNLTEDEIMAIALYTVDLRIPLDCTKNIYYQLNAMLRRREPLLMQKWRGYLYYLQSALSKLPLVSTKVYRGIEEREIFKTYTSGRKIHWTSFTSTTTALAGAQKFATSNGVVVCMKVRTGKYIGNYSVYPREEEILLSPNMSFFVNEALHQKEDGMWYVELVQEDPEANVFIF